MRERGKNKEKKALQKKLLEKKKKENIARSALEGL